MSPDTDGNFYTISSTQTDHGPIQPAVSPDFGEQTHTFAHEGAQDDTNWLFVRGWAWDSRNPDVPVEVDIYDGDTRLGTVVADLYRPDLRQAGKGNGRHGFVYPLVARARFRRRRHITVRIAGSDTLLLDPRTGAPALPIRRRDRPARIQHFSLSPIQLWLYYRLLYNALTPFPWPVWRLPAALLACGTFLRPSNGRLWLRPLLQATGHSSTLAHRWRAYWACSFRRHAARILLVQAAKLTPDRLRQLIDCTEIQLPPGGAILIAPHHALNILGALALSTATAGVAGVTGEATGDALLASDETVRRHWRCVNTACARTPSMKVISLQAAGKEGLRHLQDGGYLILFSDIESDGPSYSLLKKAVRYSRGAAWFAQRSGKPIIPWMVVPAGMGWRLWLGEDVPPTEQGVIQGLETCIRMAPASWERYPALMWLEAPVAPDEQSAV